MMAAVQNLMNPRMWLGSQASQSILQATENSSQLRSQQSLHYSAAEQEITALWCNLTGSDWSTVKS